MFLPKGKLVFEMYRGCMAVFIQSPEYFWMIFEKKQAFWILQKIGIGF